MEIKQLRHFIETYRLQSYTEAAKHCIITPQGLHISINRLEEELGCRLFLRSSNGLVLTEAGKYLLPKAQEIVRISTEVAEHFYHPKETEERISVLFVRGTVELIALPSIAQFKEIYPDADVSFRVESDYACIQSVINGETDMAVCAGPIYAKSLARKHLFTRKNMLVINKEHPLAGMDSVSVADIKELSLVLPENGVSVRNTVLELCREESFEPKYIENDDPRTAFYCAEVGLQAGIVNEISAGKLLKDTSNVAIVPFRDHRLDWEIFLIKRSDIKQTKMARAYESCLLQTAKKVLNLR